MKWQLICFSCSVNQFITKRKHTHTHTVQSFPLWYPRSRRTLRSFHSELTDKLRNQQLHTSSTCLWRFPMSDMERTQRAHTHTYTLLTINLRTDNNLKTSNNQLQLLQQPTTAAAAAVAAAAQKAYAMLAHWWRLHTDTTEPTGNNCQTGCHSHTRVPTRTHTLLTFEHTLNTHSDWALKVMLPALPAATHGAH